MILKTESAFGFHRTLYMLRKSGRTVYEVDVDGPASLLKVDRPTLSEALDLYLCFNEEFEILINEGAPW